MTEWFWAGSSADIDIFATNITLFTQHIDGTKTHALDTYLALLTKILIECAYFVSDLFC